MLPAKGDISSHRRQHCVDIASLIFSQASQSRGLPTPGDWLAKTALCKRSTLAGRETAVLAGASSTTNSMIMCTNLGVAKGVKVHVEMLLSACNVLVIALRQKGQRSLHPFVRMLLPVTQLPCTFCCVTLVTWVMDDRLLSSRDFFAAVSHPDQHQMTEGETQQGGKRAPSLQSR